MKHNRLIIQELEESLTFWEDLFLITKLQEKAKVARDKDFMSAMSEFKLPSDIKTIKNPEEFRKELYRKSEIDPERFIPLVPKEARQWLNPVDYARTAPINASTLISFPYMIAHWLKTKKVFHVDPGLIPLLNPKKTGLRDLFSKKNFLNLLPCDAFVLHFTNPLEIEMESMPIIKRYKSCIVVRSGDLIDTFWIPDQIETKSIKTDGREFLKKLLKKRKPSERELRKLLSLAKSVSINEGMRADKVSENRLQITVEPPYFALMSFSINKPYSFIMSVGNKNNQRVRIFRDVFKKTPVEYEELNGTYKPLKELIGENEYERITIKERVRFQKFFFEFINGFCYALSEIKAKKLDPIPNGKDLKSSDFSLSLPWNEIPITRVEYLSEDDSNSKLKISYGSGEKTAHIRRGHWRHILKKDGSTQTIWIAQTMVRADRLEKRGEELKGNVTVIRNKRAVVR